MRDLALFYSALADENRLRLLYLMKDGEICVCFLQGVLQTNQPKISRHLAYLKKAGLVEARRNGKWMYYRLKKLEGNLQRILTETLKGLSQRPEIKDDLKRRAKICGSPARFGFSSPEPKSCC